MKLSNSYFYTLREDSKDEESVSGNLLVKAGMIKKVSNGIYMYMPMGLKVLRNIENIVREEMNKAGANELTMPQLLPQEIYESSGRLNNFGKSMFKLNDRYERPYALGPTHEELFVEAAKMMLKSYKNMPFNLYQIGNKYRDEVRPRLGLIRVREFTMKDAYSFDRNEAGLDESYKKMFIAYNNIFDRVNLKYKVVRADTGVMGGTLSEEYQAITDTGEDILVLCDKCECAHNIEIATNKIIEENSIEKEKKLVETPHMQTIEDVSNYLNIDSKNTIKAILLNVNDALTTLFIRGDRELNETKVCKALHISEITFANDELINKTNAVAGFTGPIGLNSRVIIDEEVLSMKNFCCGANKEGYHYINVNIKDINYDEVYDIRTVKENDVCPNCGGNIYLKKGIEVGNIFKLGTKYCEALNLQYLDENNKLNYPYMGCYGIGIPRIMASVVEQYNDAKGIIWPISIAPYKVSIVIISDKDELQIKKANELYDSLINLGIDTILDDRSERAGVKFNDMDLVGIPIRVTIGKKINDNLVEFKLRQDAESTDLGYDEVLNKIIEIVKKENN